MSDLKYNNNEYKNLITEFFGEIFYLPGLSYGTKIQKIRQYTEIVLRRLLDYSCDKNIEIGNNFTIEKLDKKGFTEPLLRDSLEVIRSAGNERTHTKFRHTATEEEYQKVLNCIFNIYGYLFYKFFKKWPFGRNPDIVTAFSILPPIIRHITLTALYEDDPNKPIIVNKLILAKLKAYGKEASDYWVESHKDMLLTLYPDIDSDTLKTLITIVGREAAFKTVAAMSNDMYHICKEKIATVKNRFFSSPLYSDFETAKTYYEQHGVVPGNSQEIMEFNDLMEFIYIGRRKRETEISLIPERNYIISRIVWFSPEKSDD